MQDVEYLLWVIMKFNKIIFSFAVIVFFFITEGYSQVPRMGVPMSTYKIPAYGSIRITAFCLDYQRTSPSSKSIYRFVLKEFSETRVENANKFYKLQEAIDRDILEITGKKFEIEEFINLLKGSLSQEGMSARDKKQNERFIKLWENITADDRKKVESMISLNNCISTGFFDDYFEPENILYPVVKSWAFIPDSLKTLFHSKYNYLLEPMQAQVKEQIENIRDHTALQFVNRTNSDIIITLKDDIILGDPNESTEFLIETLGGIKFTNQDEIWNNQIKAILKVLEPTKCVDESNTNALSRLSNAVKCFQKKNKLPATGTIDGKTENLLLMEYKKSK